jgi:hypothetical protein
MLTRTDYVSLWQAQQLKKLGFTNICTRYYTTDGNLVEGKRHAYNREDSDLYFAPTLWEVASWLRVNGLHVSVMPTTRGMYEAGVTLLQPPYKYNSVGYLDDYNEAFRTAVNVALMALLKPNKKVTTTNDD